MISSDKQTSAIRVIQQLVIFGRKMAYDKISHKEIATLLDDLEYLPGLMLKEEDTTDEFRKYIEDIADEHNLSIILDIFDN